MVSKGEALVALRRVRNRKKQRAFEVRLRDDEGDYVLTECFLLHLLRQKKKRFMALIFKQVKRFTLPFFP